MLDPILNTHMLITGKRILLFVKKFIIIDLIDISFFYVYSKIYIFSNSFINDQKLN